MTAFAPLLVLVVVAAVTVAAEPLAPSVEPQVAAALKAEVRSRLGAQAEVSIDRVQLSLRDGASGSLAVTPVPQATLGGTVAFVVIGAGANGRPVQVGRGEAMVTVRVPFAQATRTLGRGAVLTEADVTEVIGDPGRVPLRRLPTARELVGGTLRRDVVAGAVLLPASVAPPAAVRAGEPVEAVAKVGTVQVTAELTSLDNGLEGAIVRVVNRESKRELRARVVRPGVVEVIHE